MRQACYGSMANYCIAPTSIVACTMQPPCAYLRRRTSAGKALRRFPASSVCHRDGVVDFSIWSRTRGHEALHRGEQCDLLECFVVQTPRKTTLLPRLYV